MTVHPNPYRAVSYELVPHGISLRQLARSRGKSKSWAGNIAAGWQPWSLAFESALYEASDGDVKLIERIRTLADEAFELRRQGVAS